MTDEPMSGAEFQREVGDDPDKWADAMMAAAKENDELGIPLDREWLRGWLTDFADAVLKHRPPIVP